MSAWREIDRRAAYYRRSALERSVDPLEFQRRFQKGQRFLAQLRARSPAPRAQARPSNVVVGRWWPRRAGAEL